MPLLIGSILALAPAMPSSALKGAHMAPSAMAGFAYVSGDGSIQSAYDSAGGQVSVNHIATGQYDVVFGNLGFAGGDVQITSLSRPSCTVPSWYQSGADLHVTVFCYKGPSFQTDEGFEVLVTQPRSHPGGVLDYNWVNKPSGKLTGTYQYNSSHKVDSVRHPARGEYVVSMPGPGTAGASQGTVKVSPYGYGSGFCQVAGWRTNRVGEQITVRCFDSNGAPQDRQFTIVYARGNNLMGQNGEVTANAFASSGNVLYQPRVQFDSRRGARITIIHLDIGYYEAVFVGSNISSNPNGGGGNLQVTPVSNRARICSVQPVSTRTPAVFITCSDPFAPADTAFTVQWVVN